MNELSFRVRQFGLGVLAAAISVGVGLLGVGPKAHAQAEPADENLPALADHPPLELVIGSPDHPAEDIIQLTSYDPETRRVLFTGLWTFEDGASAPFTHTVSVDLIRQSGAAAGMVIADDNVTIVVHADEQVGVADLHLHSVLRTNDKNLHAQVDAEALADVQGDVDADADFVHTTESLTRGEIWTLKAATALISRDLVLEFEDGGVTPAVNQLALDVTEYFAGALGRRSSPSSVTALTTPWECLELAEDACVRTCNSLNDDGTTTSVDKTCIKSVSTDADTGSCSFECGSVAECCD